eukprot:3136859-Pleurochrysis_carterae.AAC.1
MFYIGAGKPVGAPQWAVCRYRRHVGWFQALCDRCYVVSFDALFHGGRYSNLSCDTTFHGGRLYKAMGIPCGPAAGMLMNAGCRSVALGLPLIREPLLTDRVALCYGGSHVFSVRRPTTASGLLNADSLGLLPVVPYPPCSGARPTIPGEVLSRCPFCVSFAPCQPIGGLRPAIPGEILTRCRLRAVHVSLAE